jgi:cell division inhibitor SepF
MGATVDKFINFMKLDNKDEEDDEDYGFDEEETSPRGSSRNLDDDDEASEKPKKSSKGMFKNNNDNRRKGMSASVNAGVSMRFPKELNDAAEVVDDLKSMNSVVLNLQGLDSSLAQSIYDFLCGACYALGCRMEKVSDYVYVITPESVTLSGDLLSAQGPDGNGLF